MGESIRVVGAWPKNLKFTGGNIVEDLIKALIKLSKYGKPKYPTFCEHDVLHICDIAASEVTSGDVKELERLGFLVDAEYDGFMSFKFGSA